MITNRKNIHLEDMELKFAPDGTGGWFKGYASVFGGVDSYGDTIMAGAYSNVLNRIGERKARMPKMFVNHKSWEIPVGKWTAMEQDGKGLYMEGELTPNNPDSDIVKASLQHGTIDGLSIGFVLGDYEIIEENGEKLRIIKSIKELPEVSIVTYPADDSARVDLTSVKSVLEGVQTVRDFEDFLREVGGFSKALAKAAAGQARDIFAQREVGASESSPEELKRQIALNLLLSKSLRS